MEITRKLPSLIRFEDCKGQTPLHYAAFKSWPEGLEVLLKKDPLAVYCRDRNGRTAAHIAAQCNDVRGVQLFAGLRQDCCEVLDNNGQNVAHCAAEWGSGDVFRYLLDSSQFVHLMYQKDIHGNTPLHLFAESIPGLYLESLSSMRRNDVISLLQKRMKPVFNNENCTPGDIAAKHMDTISELEPSNQQLLRKFVAVAPTSSRNKDLQELIKRSNVTAEEERKREASRVLKAVKVYMGLSILLAGISYQAGISVPGGFNQNDSDQEYMGTSLLMRRSRFQAFVAVNSISFMASVIEAILYATVWVNNGTGIWKTVFAWTTKLTFLSVGLLVTAYVISLYSTTWKSKPCTIIISLLFTLFLLVYVGFLAWALRYNRARRLSRFVQISV